MFFSAENILFIGSILVFVSIIAGSTGYRFGVPSLLLFLLVGMLFGSDGIGVQFSNYQQAQFIGMIALSVILFSGGLDTSVGDIKPVALEGVILSTLGVVMTAVITGLFIYGLLYVAYPSGKLSMATCMLLAAVMSSTDSASVFSILRSKGLHLKENLRPLLELESGSNDPMAYMLTIMLIQYVQHSSLSVGVMVWTLVIQFVLGAVLGYLFGRLAVYVTNRINLDYAALYSIMLLAFALFTFSFTNLVNGNGYLAVYIAGLVIGNHKMMYKKSVITFFDGIAWLVQIVMFLALGLLVNPKELWSVALVSLVIGIFMILVARPITVFACLLPFRKLSRKARVFTSWVGLRGAVPIIFATYPYVAEVPGADKIFNIVFCITIISLIIQGSSIPYVAKFLELVVPEKPHKEFAVEIPEDMAVTSELHVTQGLLVNGDKLEDLHLSSQALVIMIKRDEEYFIPHNDTEILPGDKLLIMAKKEEDLHDIYQNLDIDNYEIYKNQ